MFLTKIGRILSLVIVASMLIAPGVFAVEPLPTVTDGPADAAAASPKASHRLIVELESPALAAWYQSEQGAQLESGRLDVQSAAARDYMAKLEAEQAAFAKAMTVVLPEAAVSTYVNSEGGQVAAAYQVVLNAVAVDPGTSDTEVAMRALRRVPGVKRVYRDYVRQVDMYASIPLIDAPAMWADLGGQDMSGEGIIVASIDTGVYAPNPFFDPAGFAYPPGYPVGDARFTTEKVIGARAYFRSWDPPLPGDDTAWPGPAGSSHGTHTIGTAAGNMDTVADLSGLQYTISGVAPKAQILSYRVFYPTSSEYSGSAFDAEIVMAFEDAVLDGADVINYSAGGYSGVMPWADATNLAREAAWDAGVFVSHSAGNSGPGYSTTWGSSPKVMEVGASTHTGNIGSGRLSVTEPQPVPPELQEMPFANASFGGVLDAGSVYSWPLVTAASVDPANFEGCNPWPAGTFTGKAAVISRGACEFGVKVLNAEQAGAEFVVIYNHVAGGDQLVNMGGGAVGDQVTIPSVFIWHSSGLAIVDWYDTHGNASELEIDLVSFQAGNVPDVIASFSSRGPASARFLEPDVTAPGVSILSAGYATGVTGVDRHMGFGQAGGTSMAAPHVAGAAALLKQMHPGWTPTQIMSALKSTSVTEVWLDRDQTVPATVLDMGAGRIDLGEAGDPGLTFMPSSLSFGPHKAGEEITLSVAATDVSGLGGTYDLSVTADEGISTTLGADSLTFAAGESKNFDVTVKLPIAPARVRVAHASPDAPPVDILVDDAVAFPGVAFEDVTDYAELPAGTYNVKVVPAGTTTPVVIEADLTLLSGNDYTVAAVDLLADIEPLVLVDDNSDPAAGQAHVRFVHASPDAPAVDIAVTGGPVLFADVGFKEVGDYQPVDAGTYDLEVRLAGTETVVLSLPGVTVDDGVVYTAFAMGLAAGTPALTAVVTVDNAVPAPQTVAPGDYGGFVWLDDGTHMNHIPLWVRVEAPMADAEVLLIDNDFSDLLGYPDYTGYYTNTLESLGVDYDYYNADLNFANPRTLPTAAELAAYDVVIYWSGDNYNPDGTFTVSTPLTELDLQTLTDWQFNGGRLLVTGQDLASAWDALDSGGDGYFIYAGNLGTRYLQDSMFDPGYAGMLPPTPAVAGVPGSPLSGVVLDISGSPPITDTVDDEVVIVGWEDGAANQYYVDEVELAPFGDTGAPETIKPILSAIDGSPVADGLVASSRADGPTLEEPETAFDYRTIYLSFGFEGINSDTGFTTREELMAGLLNWLTDEVEVTLEPAEGRVNDVITLMAEFTSSVDAGAVQYRWDFGDGSEIAVTSEPSAVHIYEAPGTYDAQVEVTDALGHTAVSEEAMVTVAEPVYLTKTAEPRSQSAGGLITYTLSFVNFGPNLSGVVLSDTLPAEVEFFQADPPATYDPVAHEVVWTGLDLDQAVELSATIVVTVAAGVDLCTPMTNTAYLLDGDTVLDWTTITHNYCYYYFPIIIKE